MPTFRFVEFILPSHTLGVAARWNSKKAALDSSAKERWTINSNGLAVFSVSRQCIYEVNVLSTGTPMSLTRLPVGVEYLVFATGNVKEMGGNAPQLRTSTFLGLLVGPHSGGKNGRR